MVPKSGYRFSEKIMLGKSYSAAERLGENAMSLNRRTLLLGSLSAGLARPFVARAQSWPSGPIRVVVPFPPGGSVDTVARLAQNGLQQRLGTSVIVENRPGASGSVGTAAVAKS